MIEHLVDNAIGTLIATIPGMKVRIGMEDNEPALECPYCVVWSNVTRVDGRRAVSELVTTIEYQSISGQNNVGDVETAVTTIDELLSVRPSSDVLAALPLSGLGLLAWEHIPITQQETGDRRRIVRQLHVSAQLA